MARGDEIPFLQGLGGDLAPRIAAFDWSRTSLGPIGAWPEHLRAALVTMLEAPVPMVLIVGSEHLLLYNDGYALIAGGRHPGLLGRPVLEGWPEVAAFNAGVLRTVLAGGTQSFRDKELVLLRNGVEESVWLNLDYWPLRDPDGRPVGVFALLTETTDKVRSQRAVADERERLRQMFEQAPSFMALLGGPDHVFELANAAYRQLVGHRDVVGLPVRQVLPDIEGQGYFELLDQVYRSGETFVGRGATVTLQREPGGTREDRILDFLYQPLRNAAGAVTGVFVEGIDITERVAAERAQRASEVQFRGVAEAMPALVFATSPKGELEWVNRRATDYSGLSAAGLDARGCAGLVHPEDRDAALARRAGAVQAEGVFDAEIRLRRHDGVYRAHLVRAAPLRDSDGKLLRWIGTCTDIEDRRRDERALRDSELRLRLSQEAAGIASLEVDIETGQVFGSDTLWSLWGLPPADSVPINVMENLVHPEDATVRSTEASRRAGNARPSVEYRIRRADTGEERWIARHIEFLADESGRPRKMFGVMRDVSEAKAAEIRQQLLTHELEHRIKNILATVSAIASQTLRDTDVATARVTFDQRLQALAAAHDILTRTHWTAASLRTVVEAALAPFQPERIGIAGPDLQIGPRRALSLALAVNELGTNALKYGALSGEGEGRVDVRWSRQTGEDGAPRLRWIWRESGGPPVAPPQRRGFGRLLLERVLASDFEGSVRIEYLSSGVTCVMDVPWPGSGGRQP